MSDSLLLVIGSYAPIARIVSMKSGARGNHSCHFIAV